MNWPAMVDEVRMAIQKMIQRWYKDDTEDDTEDENTAIGGMR